MERPLSIAMMGTRGVPARYGGFETAAQEIGSRLVRAGHRVTVYCRPSRPGRASESQSVSEHEGMHLVSLPYLPIKQIETLSHTLLSIRHELHRPDRADAVVMFNAANGLLLPLLRRAGIPVAVNTDGLEWMRGKWGRVGQSYYRLAERACVHYADLLIADAQAIQNYYADRFGTASEFIPYGAAVLEGGSTRRLAEAGLEPQGYHLVVARLEPENNVDMILAGYRASSAQLPLVVVGGNPYNPRAEERLRAASVADLRIRPLGSVWDQDLLDQLYLGSASYLHGHSVGGTNPSLLRAMGAGARVLAYDSPFNREVLIDLGYYFATAPALADLLGQMETKGSVPGAGAAFSADATRDRVKTAYNWDLVAAGYLDVCRRLVESHAGRGGTG